MGDEAMKKAIVGAMVGGAALWLSGAAQAAIIAQETWDASGDERDWTIAAEVGAPAASLSTPGAFGNGASALQVNSDTAGDFTPDTDTISTSGGDGSVFLGDYSLPAGVGTDWVQFDFFMNSTAEAGGFGSTPGFLQLYFVGGGVTWYYEIDVSGQSADTWVTYQVPFTGGSFTPAGWTDLGSSTLGFDSDKTSITEIGFRITYLTDTAGQQFGFDNFTTGYSVPEPETYATIGFALVGMCIAFRRRINEVLSMARANIAA
jgi:hypothetical protein